MFHTPKSRADYQTGYPTATAKNVEDELGAEIKKLNRATNAQARKLVVLEDQVLQYAKNDIPTISLGTRRQTQGEVGGRGWPLEVEGKKYLHWKLQALGRG